MMKKRFWIPPLIILPISLVVLALFVNLASARETAGASPPPIEPVDCNQLSTPVIGYEVSRGQNPGDVLDFLNDLVAQGYGVGTVIMGEDVDDIPPCVNVLIVHGLANNQALATDYLPKNGKTLRDWVAAGHGLMLSGDWGLFREGTQALFQAFGYTMPSGVVRDATDFDPGGPVTDPHSWVIYQTDNFASHPILDGVDSLQLQTSSWLDDPAAAIVTADADATPAAAPVMAAFRHQVGCVAMTTDSNWYATDSGSGGISSGTMPRWQRRWWPGCWPRANRWN